MRPVYIIDGARTPFLKARTAFAPFRGGPLHYAKRRGVENVVSTLQALEQKYGKRFSPDPGWDQLKRRA